jgi:hypothetical protein
MAQERSGDNPRGQPFRRGKSGNPAGRPRGARNRATLAAEALLEGEAEALTRKAIELALGGDITALRLCLDRIVPPRREQLLAFELSELKEIHDAKRAVSEIIAAVADGNVTTSEAVELVKLVEIFIRIFNLLEGIEKPEKREISAAELLLLESITVENWKHLIRPRNVLP